MSHHFKKLIALPIVFCAFFCSVQVVSAQDWRPVSQKEMDMKTSLVEPNADAEVIFWEVRVDDSNENLTMKHYIRAKVFSERGREKYSKIDIPYLKGTKIKDIKARIIKQDGSIVELEKSDVFEREIVKTDKVKVKAKSFAVPNIEPGVIVEYRYQEVSPLGGTANNMRMTFQHDVPIENITYYFKPYNNARYLTFNMSDNKFIKDKNGFYRATMENVPAIKSEPQMPPEDEVRSWLVLYYTNESKQTAEDFWSRFGGYIVSTWDIKDTLKPNKEMKAAAEQITAGAATPEEKLEKAYQFCKTKIKNIDYDTQLTEEQKDDIKPNKSTNDTHKKLQGNSADVNELFASLATALGFEARLAFGGDRSQKFFNPQQAHHSFIHFTSIAVRVNNRWKYYDPGNLFTEAGMLPWYEEDTSVLLLGSKDYLTTTTPISEPEKSLAKRTGKFKLLEDGTLEGDVRIEYTGHLGQQHKSDNYKLSSNKREEDLKEEIKKQLSTAEISNINIENVSEPDKPFVYTFKLRVPNYAQKTGKRLFLQPGFFEYGKSSMFPNATRKHKIYFQFPWAEQDNIEFTLPDGYALDGAEQPAVVSDPSRIGALNIKIGTNKEQTFLRYKRDFYFGGQGHVLFPVEAYQPLKQLFEGFHNANAHTITLKQK